MRGRGTFPGVALQHGWPSPTHAAQRICGIKMGDFKLGWKRRERLSQQDVSTPKSPCNEPDEGHMAFDHCQNLVGVSVLY